MAEIGTAFAFVLTGKVSGANGFNSLTKEALNSTFDFEFVGLRIDNENIFIVGVSEAGGLFAQANGFDDGILVFHAVLRARVSTASGVRRMAS